MADNIFIEITVVKLFPIWRARGAANLFVNWMRNAPQTPTEDTQELDRELVFYKPHYRLRNLLLLAALFLFPASSRAVDTTPVDRYGGHFNAPANEFGVTYHFHVQPNINDFEYRSILNDLFAVAKLSTSTLSSCARYKVVEVLLDRADPYLTYPDGVFRSSVPFDANSLNNVCIEGEEPLTFYQP